MNHNRILHVASLAMLIGTIVAVLLGVVDDNVLTFGLPWWVVCIAFVAPVIGSFVLGFAKGRRGDAA
jgi:hypothetical protein